MKRVEQLLIRGSVRTKSGTEEITPEGRRALLSALVTPAGAERVQGAMESRCVFEPGGDDG